ncbi:VWA domain-containing protein [bacterium]|nr:VWA domain-containing protein [bacterium]
MTRPNIARWRPGLALAALMALSAPLAAAGILLPTDFHLPGIIVGPPPLWVGSVVLEETRITGRLEDGRVRLVYEERFTNRGGGLAEGTLVWPIPPGFNVVSLTLGDGTTFLEGEVYSAVEARAIYERIVRRRRDPALLELVGRGLLSVRAFPIPAGESRVVRVEVEGPVQRLGSLRQLRLPLRGEGSEAERVVVDIEVATSYDLRTLYSPTPGAAVSRDGARSGRVLYGRETPGGAKALQILLSARRGDLNLDVVARVERDPIPGGEGAGTFYLSLSGLPDSSDAGPKEFLLVLDVSGSMAGEKVEQALAAARFILDHLGPEDSFDLVAFSTLDESAFGELRPATPENLDAARAFLARQEALGGTNYEAAIGAVAAHDFSGEVPAYVVFLTDGRPTVGDTTEAGLLAALDSKDGYRLFVFGVGDDVNIPLLDRMAAARRGRGVYIAPGANLEVQLSAFYTAIDSPALAEVELEFLGVEAFSILPRPLPDLFAGTDLVVSGRFTGAGTATVVVRGIRGGERIERRYEVDLSDGGRSADFVPRLWAGRQIGLWLDAIRLQGETPELVESVTGLAKRYGILTPYTSFLALEEEFRERMAEGDMPAAFFDQSANSAGALFSTAPPGSTLPADASRARKDSAFLDALRRGASLGDYEDTLVAYGIEVRRAAGRAFVSRDGVWTELAYDPEAEVVPAALETYSDEWFALASADDGLREILAVGESVLYLWDGAWTLAAPAEEG